LKTSGSYTRPDIKEYTGNRSQRRTYSYFKALAAKISGKHAGEVDD
jgi:hypothetical protein